jgi:hypothetical protein
MKILLAIFCIVITDIFSAMAQNAMTYIVKDSLGRPIIKTANKSLVYSMQNVVVDSVQQEMITVCPLKNNVIADKIKSSIEARIGKPTNGEYYYRVEWNIKDSLEIVIVKTVNVKPILYCNRKGLVWLKRHEPGLIDTLK